MKFCSGLPQTSFIFISNSNSIRSLSDSAPRYPELISFHFWSRFYWKYIWFCSGPHPTNFISFLSSIEMNTILLWTASNQFPWISNWNWIKKYRYGLFQTICFISHRNSKTVRFCSGMLHTNVLSFLIKIALKINKILVWAAWNKFSFISN